MWISAIIYDCSISSHSNCTSKFGVNLKEVWLHILRWPNENLWMTTVLGWKNKPNYIHRKPLTYQKYCHRSNWKNHIFELVNGLGFPFSKVSVQIYELLTSLKAIFLQQFNRDAQIWNAFKIHRAQMDSEVTKVILAPLCSCY